MNIAVPAEIVAAVNAILAPYGREFTPSHDERGPAEDVPPRLSVREATRYCGGLSYSTFRRAHVAGALPMIKLGEGKNCKILFERSALDKWMSSKRLRGGDKTLKFKATLKQEAAR